MRVAILCLIVTSCGEEEPEPFGIEPPDFGQQIHVGPTMVKPGTDRTVCQGSEYPGGADLISGVELLARPSLQAIEVYLLEEPADAAAVDCPGLPESVMGSLARPIRMVYYSDSDTDSFTFPGGVAVAFADHQPLLLRYRYRAGAEEEEELDVFLNFLATSEATVAAPFTFSNKSITIPPFSNTEITTTCPFDSGRKIVTVAGHQHGYELNGVDVGAGTGVTVSHGGATVLHGRAGPWAVLGPLSIPRDEGLTFTCTFVNNSAETIEYGPGPFDEMCRIFGWVFPAEGPLMATAFNQLGEQICEIVENAD